MDCCRPPRRQALLRGSLAAVPAIAGGVSAESARASTTDLLVTGLEVATVTGTSVIITWFTGPATEAGTCGFPLPIAAGTALQTGLAGVTDTDRRAQGTQDCPGVTRAVPEPEHQPRTVTMTAAPNAQPSRPAPPEHCSTTPKTPAHGAHVNRFPTPVRLLAAGLPLRALGPGMVTVAWLPAPGRGRGAGQWPGGARSGAGLPFSPLMAPVGWMRPRRRSSPAAACRIRTIMSNHTPLACGFPAVSNSSSLAFLVIMSTRAR
jgi:hypothetical protein